MGEEKPQHFSRCDVCEKNVCSRWSCVYMARACADCMLKLMDDCKRLDRIFENLKK